MISKEKICYEVLRDVLRISNKLKKDGLLSDYNIFMPDEDDYIYIKLTVSAVSVMLTINPIELFNVNEVDLSYYVVRTVLIKSLVEQIKTELVTNGPYRDYFVMHLEKLNIRPPKGELGYSSAFEEEEFTPVESLNKYFKRFSLKSFVPDRIVLANMRGEKVESKYFDIPDDFPLDDVDYKIQSILIKYFSPLFGNNIKTDYGSILCIDFMVGLEFDNTVFLRYRYLDDYTLFIDLWSENNLNSDEIDSIMPSLKKELKKYFKDISLEVVKW